MSYDSVVKKKKSTSDESEVSCTQTTIIGSYNSIFTAADFRRTEASEPKNRKRSFKAHVDIAVAWPKGKSNRYFLTQNYDRTTIY